MSTISQLQLQHSLYSMHCSDMNKDTNKEAKDTEMEFD